MPRTYKIAQNILIIFAIVLLTGCTLGNSSSGTPTPDLNTISTSAASTAFVQLTNAAAAATSTFTPSPQPSATLASAPTDTAEPGVATDTPEISESPTLSLEATSLLTGTVIPSVTPVSVASAGGDTTTGCLRSKYINDITIPDGTILKPGEKFEKIWRMQNTGTCRWDEGFVFQGWSPETFNGQPHLIRKLNQFVEAGAVVDIGIDMRAPYNAGNHVSHWSWYDDSGNQFGSDFTVVINVSP